jgi:hypothetical protein
MTHKPAPPPTTDEARHRRRVLQGLVLLFGAGSMAATGVLFMIYALPLKMLGNYPVLVLLLGHELGPDSPDIRAINLLVVFQLVYGISGDLLIAMATLGMAFHLWLAAPIRHDRAWAELWLAGLLCVASTVAGGIPWFLLAYAAGVAWWLSAEPDPYATLPHELRFYFGGPHAPAVRLASTPNTESRP